MKINICIISILSCFAFLPAHASHDPKHPPRCEPVFWPYSGDQARKPFIPKDFEFPPIPENWNEKDHFEFYGTDLQSEPYPTLRAFARDLYAPGRVYDLFKMPHTKQILQFMPGTDLEAAISGELGVVPLTHYIDGANVAKSTGKFGALEVVVNGPKIQVAFYRNDNAVEKQKSIVAHVGGHNNFFMKSKFVAFRAYHGTYESYALDKVLNNYYQQYDEDEIQKYLLYLMNLQGWSDYETGFYQSVQDLKAKALTPQMSPMDIARTMIPTANALNALIARNAQTTPSWKFDIAERSTRLIAARPAIIQTQILNEGWATLHMIKAIKPLSQWASFEHILVTSGMVRLSENPQLKDPYWLGVNAWLNVYRKFRQRPEIAALPSELEIDMRFMEYGQNEIIAKMNDAQFLRFALDRYWIDKYALSIVKPVPPNENIDWDRVPPQPRHNQPLAVWKVQSRDPEKVIEAIIKDSFESKFRYRPRVEYLSDTRPASGEIELSVRNEFGMKVPLDKKTVGPVLYSAAQIANRSVSLECTLAETEFRYSPFSHSPIVKDKIGRFRVVVAPNGKTIVYILDKKSETIKPELTKYIQDTVRNYIEDIEYNPNSREISKFINASMQKSLSAVITSNIDAVATPTLISQVPSAARALQKYKVMLEQRLAGRLMQFFKGRKDIVSQGSNRSVYVKALPSVMALQFDRGYLQRHSMELGLYFKPTDSLTGFEDAKFIVRQKPDDQVIAQSRRNKIVSSIVEPVDMAEGDYVWGPDLRSSESNSGGQGDGKSDEDRDPSWVKIPEDLFAKILAEKIKLPFVQKKGDRSQQRDEVQAGSMNYQHGDPLTDEIIENLISKGLALLTPSERNKPDRLKRALLKGMRHIEPEHDWVVAGTETEKQPESSVVVSFVADASGSSIRFLPAYKRAINFLKMLISQNYKNVVYKFILFNTKAFEVTEHDFYRRSLSGGTDYSSALKMDLAIKKEQFPRNKWNRYTFLFGDMEDDLSNVAESLKHLISEQEYVGFMMAGSADHFDLPKYLEGLHVENPHFGFVNTGPEGDFNLGHLQDMLKSKDE